ncbi:hypothetical protein L1887_07478 [Cichorium endivia]|nr:hypothetical protein L1887_07478 [Cichorium endivia]
MFPSYKTLTSSPFFPTALGSQQLILIQASTAAMEAMKTMKLFALMLVMMTMAISAVSAADAPAPAPSDATTVFVPTAIASLSALAVAFVF